MKYLYGVKAISIIGSSDTLIWCMGEGGELIPELFDEHKGLVVQMKIG